MPRIPAFPEGPAIHTTPWVEVLDLRPPGVRMARSQEAREGPVGPSPLFALSAVFMPLDMAAPSKGQ